MPLTEELNHRDQSEAGNLRAHETRERVSTTENEKQERRDVNQELPHTMANNSFPQYIPWYGYNQYDMQPVRNDGHLFERLLESQVRQSYMFNQLLERQQAKVNAVSLPQRDLPLFDGDPTKYCDFIENLIESKTSSPSARLYYLVQYTTGQVQELMHSCLPMRDDEGYREARKLLLERFGQPYKIACALVEEIANGSVIRADDGASLQKLSVQLTSCSNALKEIGYVSKHLKLINNS